MAITEQTQRPYLFRYVKNRPTQSLEQPARYARAAMVERICGIKQFAF
jgi:hypothetical protein